MKWPWNRGTHPKHEPSNLDEQGLDDAHAALENALALWPDVREVTEEIRGIRRRNHLAEITDLALRNGR